MPNSSKLRELASWYRNFAERTANPMIWEARLHTAEDLEAEADRIDGSADDLADRSRGDGDAGITIRTRMLDGFQPRHKRP